MYRYANIQGTISGIRKISQPYFIKKTETEKIGQMTLRPGICVKYFLSFPHKNLPLEEAERNKVFYHSLIETNKTKTFQKGFKKF